YDGAEIGRDHGEDPALPRDWELPCERRRPRAADAADGRDGEAELRGRPPVAEDTACEEPLRRLWVRDFRPAHREAPSRPAAVRVHRDAAVRLPARHLT